MHIFHKFFWYKFEGQILFKCARCVFCFVCCQSKHSIWMLISQFIVSPITRMFLLLWCLFGFVCKKKRIKCSVLNVLWIFFEYTSMWGSSMMERLFQCFFTSSIHIVWQRKRRTLEKAFYLANVLNIIKKLKTVFKIWNTKLTEKKNYLWLENYCNGFTWVNNC